MVDQADKLKEKKISHGNGMNKVERHSYWLHLEENTNWSNDMSKLQSVAWEVILSPNSVPHK